MSVSRLTELQTARGGAAALQGGNSVVFWNHFSGGEHGWIRPVTPLRAHDMLPKSPQEDRLASAHGRASADNQRSTVARAPAGSPPGAFGQEFLPSGPAFFAEAEEFDIVVPDEETILLFHDFLGFSHQIEFLFLEIPVVQDFSAIGADQMVVMIGLVASLIFVTQMAVPALDLANQTGLIQQIERSVNRRDPNIAVRALEKRINLLGTQMLLAFHEEAEDRFPGNGPPFTVLTDYLSMLICLFHILMIMIIN